MFKVIHPNRWFFWAIASILITGLLLLWATEQYSLEQDSLIYQSNNLIKSHQTAADTSTGSTTLTAGWKTYRNEKYGFEVKYPSQWCAIEYRFVISLAQCGQENDLGMDITIEVFDTQQIAKGKADQLIKSLSESKNVSHDEVKISDELATKLITGAKYPDVAPGTKSISLIFSYKLWVYSILYYTFPDNEQKIIDQILSTFKFIK